MVAEFSRLPKNVTPVNYSLELKPNLTEFTFTGRMIVDVNVNEATDKILLNSAELQFDKATFEDSKGDKVESTKVCQCAESEVATIQFHAPLPLGGGKLYIDYTGQLNDKLKGFYRSKYVHPSGEERYAATTQFEAADARRAFPCWDEPALKATFDVSIVAEPSKTVLSNMPLKESKPFEADKSLNVFSFERTPIMSTYLLAFVVGEYDYIEGTDKNGVKIRVYTPLGKTEQGKFALDVSLKTLPFYTDYFRIGYPLPKLDLIAIADFAAGAMENWGLVTYRETALLIDPKHSSLQAKQRVAIVVGHEIAHQWFGNIVTMEWWTHLWLNEGFASWIEYLCVDHCMPEFDIWTDFVNSDYCRALELDSLKNSHPIEVPVGPPSEVDEIFDAISYSKGASTIRMLHDYIGDEAFRNGLHNYLDKFKYKNTLTEDLWEELGKASGKPVNELMQLWTKQTGYPVLSVSRKTNEKNETILTVTQERFFSNGAKPTEAENFLWKVPISIMTKSSFPKEHTKFLLEKRTDEINLGTGVTKDDWIKLNKNTIGLYRTNYSQEMLNSLTELIQNKTIHATDRLGLQTDVFALAQAGLLSTDAALKFVMGYSNEDNVIVWRDLIGNLLNVSSLLLNTNYHHELQAYIRRLLKPVSKKLGYAPIPDESPLQGLCRATILRTLGTNGDEEVIEWAKKSWENHLKGDFIPADLRAAVYATVISVGDMSVVDKMMELHDKTDLMEEKLRLACSLGCIKKEELIKKVLQFALSPSVRSQDSVSVICSVSVNTTTKLSADVAWQFIKENWSTIYERYHSGFLITRLIKTCCENFATKEEYADVDDFFKKNPVPAAQRSIQQALENINVHTAWLNRDKDKIQQYLSSLN